MKKLNPALLPIILLFIFSSCKKTTEWVNKLEDTYWTNVQNSILHISGNEAWLDATGSAPIGSNPNVFNPSTTPYITQLTQTGENQWTGQIVKGTYSGSTLTGTTKESTTITFSNENGTDKISFSNADAGMNSWSGYTSGGTTQPPLPTNKDTASVLYTDSTNTFSYTLNGSTEAYSKFAVRSGWRKLSMVDGYYWRMNAIVRPGFQDDTYFYFREKPVTSKVYKIGNGFYAPLTSLAADEVGVSFRVDCSTTGTKTVNVTVSGGKITVEGNNIPLSYNGGGGSSGLCSFRVSGK